MQQFGNVPIRLMLFLFMCQMSILTSMRLATSHDELYDPIALYAAIMPGTSISSLSANACRWQNGSAGMDILNSCVSLRGNPHYTHFDIYLNRNVIHTVAFHVEGLRVGDMPAAWGRPRIDGYRDPFTANWTYDGYCITAYLQTTLRFTYWAQITYLTIRSC